MLYETILPYEWKGNRDYVPGTDIYDSVINTLKKYFDKYPTKLIGSFHQLLKHYAVLKIYENKKNNSQKNFCSFFMVAVDNATYHVYLTNSEVPISLRYEYDEDAVIDGMNLKNDEIELLCKTRYTYIEQIVAMTKKLHLEKYYEAKGKWLFSKIELNDNIDPQLYKNKKLTVRALKHINFRLTQNKILMDNKEIGQIWFSLKKLA